METVLISGGTGLVGRHLSKKLKQKGYRVALLSRVKKTDADIPTYSWDIDKQEIDIEAIETADYIIHLAGANIGDERWTKKRKQLIIESRVKTGQLLYDKVKETNKKLKAFISASAIGYYGAITSDLIFNESAAPANDFLGNTCHLWEQTADRFTELGIRTVKIRTSLVLTEHEGALAKMIAPIKMGIVSALGNGKQYMPWIHIDDLCGIYLKAIEDTEMNGAYNAAAPAHTTNKEFTMTLARVLKKNYRFPNVPAIALKILFGGMSEILIKGSRVSSDKIIKSGYNFLFPDLESAIKNLVKIE